MIPAFTLDGILPPFLGATPAGPPSEMSPFEVTAFEVAERFGGSDNRKEILRRWLNHRQALRAIGINRGFQWLDGSFLENKEPRDLDNVTFIYRPATLSDEATWGSFVMANQSLFEREQVKAAFQLDAFFLDLNGKPEVLVSGSRYFLQLFSHQRSTRLWKGMLQVRIEDAQNDLDALALLNTTVTGGV